MNPFYCLQSQQAGPQKVTNIEELSLKCEPSFFTPFKEQYGVNGDRFVLNESLEFHFFCAEQSTGFRFEMVQKNSRSDDYSSKIRFVKLDKQER